MSKIKSFIIAVGLSAILGSGCATTSSMNVRIYQPQGTSERCNALLGQVEQELTGQYVRTTKKDGAYYEKKYPNAKIEIKTENDESGFNQPVIFLYDGGTVKERIYFSDIEIVLGRFLEDDEGETLKYVSFSYRTPVEGDLPYSNISYFDLEVKDNLEGVVEALATCSKQYQREKTEINQPPQDPQNTEEAAKPEPKIEAKLLALSAEDYELICNGQSPEEKTSELIGTIEFEECEYNSSDVNSAQLEQIVNNITSKWLKDAFLVFCGNTTKPSATKCSQDFRDYGNFQLSFDRAYTTATKVHDILDDSSKNYTFIAYPNGTKLDEKSVRIYLVKK